MLKVDCLELGDYQTNCYIVYQEGSSSCCLIDPGYEADVILAHLEQKKLTPEAILLTHGHFDHVGAVRDLAAETGCSIYIHEKELALPPMMTNGRLHYTHVYDISQPLQIAGICFHVLHTPGHTPGSVCLAAENCLFSGDTLFAGSCGRTDFPGGSWEQIQQSLKLLRAIPDDLLVYPGHGNATTLAREKASNPYMLFR